MATQTPPPWSSFLAPRHWPTWLGIALLCVIAWLPFRLRMLAGTLLGLATRAIAVERRYITGVNISLCFPELNGAEQTALVRQSFIDNGIGLVETATGWVRSPGQFQAQLRMTGSEHLDAALATGRGVLLLGAHYSTLDFGANLLSVNYPFAVTYRPHRNPLFDAFMLRGRLRSCNGVFDRRDIRGAFRHLRQNKILWYAPDQDYGPEQAVYAPFFGRPAATITAASRFAAFNKSPVVLVRQGRDMQQRCYELEFIPLPQIPTGDDLRDATLINAAIEAAIRVHPGQYLWMHKRFKTQPGGKPDSPYIHIRTPSKRLSEAQYHELMASVREAGLLLREFPGLPRFPFRARHPALRLDALSKHLRAAGLRTLTVDNIFLLQAHKLTLLTCFVPAGTVLRKDSVAPAHAAAFLARLHNAGFHFLTLDFTRLVFDGDHCGLLEPFDVARVPGSACHAHRLADLIVWARHAGYAPAAQDALSRAYLAQVRRADAAGFRTVLARHGPLADNA